MNRFELIIVQNTMEDEYRFSHSECWRTVYSDLTCIKFYGYEKGDGSHFYSILKASVVPVNL